MIETPAIVDVQARPAAVIHFRIPREEIGQVMGPGIGELMATIGRQGIAPAGPMFSHHTCVDEKFFEFDLGVPISAPVTAEGRVIPGELPAARVARTVYHGGYDGLGEAWGEFEAWLDANGHERLQNLWECYLAGPDVSPDPAHWQTELVHPLR